MTYFFRELECGGKTLSIKQLYVGTVGCVVWDAAIVLCSFLENHKYFPPGFWRGKKVLDLGSGTGVVGIATCVLGADVTVTDLPEFLSLMKENISLNQSSLCGSAEARVLVWGKDCIFEEESKQPDIILMSDVVYYKESLDDLLQTLLSLSGPHTPIIMSYEKRLTGDKPQVENSFFQMMEKHFKKKQVPFDDLHEPFRSPDIPVVIFSVN